MSGINNKKSNKKKYVPIVYVPKGIRDELRMACALKAFSKIKCGEGKRISQQQAEMEMFYHGRPPNHPSQIKLLAEASYSYRDLYDVDTTIALKKSDNQNSTTHYTLK